jgi:hypothetical protein
VANLKAPLIRRESTFGSGVVVEISYNIQAAVDNKHNLVVTPTINRNDLNALGIAC